MADGKVFSLLTNGTISCLISAISPRLIGGQASGSQVRSVKELRRGFCFVSIAILTQVLFFLPTPYTPNAAETASTSFLPMLVLLFHVE